MLVADRTGADARAGSVRGLEKGMHNHNPVWSPDGQWIYFVHGFGAADGRHGRVARSALGRIAGAD